MRISGVRDAPGGRNRAARQRATGSRAFRFGFSDIFASCEENGGRISRAG
jgi:hypothetical protein